MDARQTEFAPAADAAAVARDPQWLADRYDPGHDAVHFRPVSRAEHDRATFLTDAYLPERPPRVIRRETALAAQRDRAPIHFIFHSAYCCSTLLARAFDLPGVAMGLKEPVILNDLVGWRRRGAAPARVAQALDGALALLARPFGAGEAVVVKPSNIVNGLARVMLAMRPEAGALLLHAPLRTYLGSIAKKGMDGRLWVRELFAGLRTDGLIDLGFTDQDHLRQTDLQIGAVGWLAQHRLFAELVRAYPDRVRTLDSETLMARPAETMEALGRLCRLPIDRDLAGRITGGPAFNRHSKFDRPFAAQDRAVEHLSAAETHGDEIEKVAVWAEAVAEHAGIPPTSAHALI